MRWLVRQILLLLTLASVGVSAPAAAQTLAPDCILTTPDLQSLASVRDNGTWLCGRDLRMDSARYNWLKFAAVDHRNYRYFAMEARPFASMTLYRVGRDGQVTAKRIEPAGVRLKGFNTIRFELPGEQVNAGEIYARIEGFANVRDMPRVSLLEHADQSIRPRDSLVLAALLAGLVLAPSIIAWMLAIALRQSFVAWYALMCSGMVLTIIVTSGLAVSWIEMPLVTFLAVERAGFTLIFFASCLFARDFIEPEALSPRIRKALLWASLAILSVGAWNVFLMEGRAFFGTILLVVLALLVAAFVQASMRGSRWVRYQLVGWALPMVLVTDMGLKGVGVGGFLNNDMFIVYYAMVWEIVIGAIGVTDRVMLLRTDRDKARELAARMEGLAERDPLTGLLNRRAIDARFEALKDEGFFTCALLDLDHFKVVNDQFGHATGDEVLKAVAGALAPDKDTLAIRMGGEEFMLLLRGPDTEARAEQRRAAISVRIAREIDSLDRIVTASQGFVKFSTAAARASSFENYYMRADILLYRAKQEGRNRTVADRVEMLDVEHTATRDAA